MKKTTVLNIFSIYATKTVVNFWNNTPAFLFAVAILRRSPNMLLVVGRWYCIWKQCTPPQIIIHIFVKAGWVTWDFQPTSTFMKHDLAISVQDFLWFLMLLSMISIERWNLTAGTIKSGTIARRRCIFLDAPKKTRIVVENSLFEIYFLM